MRKIIFALVCVLLSVCALAEKYSKKNVALDWYLIDPIRAVSKEEIPSNVIVQISIGYRKDDKEAYFEIAQRVIEIKMFLRRYFAEREREELNDSDILRKQICDFINDDILSNSKIHDVKFVSLKIQ